ncbi:hypothetical protein FRACA_950004 [Frankia canadensis]|uniref:Uncharacterized protein n=1 Tax=Frankia canadensis TaxID=1836972 RepID=A0A2I2L2Q5_9ACTN|nr:hypothetical protein FRACA_950004 [Frankia canadensis]SOU59475.1 hypothetical protein FRACA_950004 [Frankia canadensis]
MSHCSLATALRGQDGAKPVKGPEEGEIPFPNRPRSDRDHSCLPMNQEASPLSSTWPATPIGEESPHPRTGGDETFLILLPAEPPFINQRAARTLLNILKEAAPEASKQPSSANANDQPNDLPPQEISPPRQDERPP